MIDGAVKRQLEVIWPIAIAVGIGVAEHAGLEYGIGGWPDAGYHVGGRETCLLDVLEVVVGLRESVSHFEG